MSQSMLHLSIPIRAIEPTLVFYVNLLGCRATRVQNDRIDMDFFGHHLVAQLSEIESAHQSVSIGSPAYPLRHFGVIVKQEIYGEILLRLQQANVSFAMQPCRIFVGTPREQSVFLVFDPSGNALEVKGLAEPDNVFTDQ